MTAPDGGELLPGGNMAGDVVRVGDTVRRAATEQTPTIHRLLQHVRARGVTWVPRAHGIDDEGREVLDYLDGAVVHDHPAWLWDDAVLIRIAAALREWHDATESFDRRPDDRWWAEPLEPAEVICHVDFAPYNHVYRDGAFVGAIDFDLCLPGPRLWDIAYTAYRYVPLTPLPDEDVPDGDSWGRSPLPRAEQRRRLALFLDTYARGGATRYDEDAALGYVVARLDALADWCETQTNPDLLRNGVMYRAHARWIESGALGDVAPAPH